MWNFGIVIVFDANKFETTTSSSENNILGDLM